MYYADGSFDETTHYESRVPKTLTQYRADGTKCRYAEYSEQGDEILNIEYQADGITEEFNMKTVYDENGNMVSDKTTWADGSSIETTYENGVIINRVDILTDGTRVEAEYYEDGETEKKSTTFNLDGTKFVTEFYENGVPKSDTEYDENDNMTRQQLYDEDGNLTSDTYYTIATSSNATPAE